MATMEPSGQYSPTKHATSLQVVLQTNPARHNALCSPVQYSLGKHGRHTACGLMARVSAEGGRVAPSSFMSGWAAPNAYRWWVMARDVRFIT